MNTLASTYLSNTLRATLIFCVSLILTSAVVAQEADTVTKPADTSFHPIRRVVKVPQDTLGGILHYADSINTCTWTERLHATIDEDPYFAFNSTPIAMLMAERVVQSDAFLFYWMLALLFMYAVLKVAFPKYLDDLLKLFFRATLRQQQLREQLLQASLPSMLYNALFFISGGFFVCFWGVYVGWFSQDHLWPNIVYGFLGLGLLYVGKYVVIRVLGWILHMERGADSYIFVVFLLNKVLGIFLLPFLLLMAFGLQGASVDWVIDTCLAMIIGMYIYRFFIAYQLVRSEIKLNLFHFFLYLCAFEVAPMLLLSKLLMKQL